MKGVLYHFEKTGQNLNKAINQGEAGGLNHFQQSILPFEFSLTLVELSQ